MEEREIGVAGCGCVVAQAYVLDDGTINPPLESLQI
jgi:hypothetical protein